MTTRKRKPTRDVRTRRSCRNCDVEYERTCPIPDEKKPCRPFEHGKRKK